MFALQFRTLALAAAVAMAASAPAMAAGPAAHSHDEASPARLTLDQGRKWSTDAPLRTGMERIRGAVDPAIAKAHAGKLTAAQSAALAGQVEAEVAGIVANCKLEPQADAMLHLVIADVLAGADAMKGKTPGVRAEQGLVRVATAVNQYARHFDHPGLRRIDTGH